MKIDIYFDDLSNKAKENIRDGIRDILLEDTAQIEEWEAEAKEQVEDDILKGYVKEENRKIAYDMYLGEKMDEKIDDIINRTFSGEGEVQC